MAPAWPRCLLSDLSRVVCFCQESYRDGKSRSTRRPRCGRQAAQAQARQEEGWYLAHSWQDSVWRGNLRSRGQNCSKSRLRQGRKLVAKLNESIDKANSIQMRKGDGIRRVQRSRSSSQPLQLHHHEGHSRMKLAPLQALHGRVLATYKYSGRSNVIRHPLRGWRMVTASLVPGRRCRLVGIGCCKRYNHARLTTVYGRALDFSYRSIFGVIFQSSG